MKRKMNWNFVPVSIGGGIIFPDIFLENTDIVRLEDSHAEGDIFYNLSDEIEARIHLTGKMILKDAITLEEIPKNLDIEIDEILEKTAKYYENEQNTLDKLEFLWENIVLEVPISLTNNSGIKLKGEGWELNREEEIGNPELAKLKDIFKGGE